MFTGIVTDVGTVLAAEQRGDLRLRIGCSLDLASVEVGASIACSGVCLTVVDKGPNDGSNWFAVDVSAETASRTAPDLWREGGRLNLERSLRLGDELGGHIVTGHVDGLATVTAVTPEGGSQRVDLIIDRNLGSSVAPKGSIALDGVSLTVNEVRDDGQATNFSVNLIPHTASETTLGEIAAGRQLNVEIDVLARYIHRMIAARAHQGA